MGAGATSRLRTVLNEERGNNDMQLKNVTTATVLALAVLVPPATALAGYEGAIAFSQRTGVSGWSTMTTSISSFSTISLSCPAFRAKIPLAN